MTREELEESIKKLEKKLEKKKAEKKNAEKNMEDIDATIGSIRDQIAAIENGLLEAVSSIEKKLGAVIGASKFKTNHLDNVKKTIYGTNSAQSIAELRESESSAVSKYYDYDGLVADLKIEIQNIQDDLTAKKALLNKTE